MLVSALQVSAQDIQLPSPDFTAPSRPMIETLQTRHSVRSFADAELTLQEISNLCWAACGQSRDEEHITAPSAMNRQEIRLFAFTQSGVYEYIAKDNLLQEKCPGDHRRLVAGRQDFVTKAPVSLVLVVDLEKFGMEGEQAMMTACVDAGIVCENINLYCQSVGLATVPRGSMEKEAISKILGLTDKQVPVMNNPVGRER